MSQLKESKHLYIPFEEIKKATKSFNDCIGEGGYGKVYKGELIISGQSTQVAIKRLNEQYGQGLKEFLTEIQLLSPQKHPNLIHLLGYCDEGKEKIIVYEYAQRGSLDKYLRDSDANTLKWLPRLKICVDAARGLDYLHNHVGNHQTIIHRDVKSSNILIDENWVAKVSDLGLSKLNSDLNRSDVVSHPCGTPGYCEPEYYFTSIVKKESDVYSFGIVLFEVLCGRLCTSIKDNNGVLLPSLSAKEYYLKNSLDEIVDPSLKEDMNLNSMGKFAAIASRCLHDDREQRPSMGLVLKELEESLNLQIGSEKVRGIFELFDLNKDGGLNKEELEALLVATNPDLKEYCSQEQISSNVDEVFRLYDKFIYGETGLTLGGLLKIYDDGDGDLDLNYEELGLKVKPRNDEEPIFSFSKVGRNLVDEHWWLIVLVVAVWVLYFLVAE